MLVYQESRQEICVDYGGLMLGSMWKGGRIEERKDTGQILCLFLQTREEGKLWAACPVSEIEQSMVII